MPDLRSKKPNRVVKKAKIKSYNSEIDDKFYGYKNTIRWTYDGNAAMFRVFRAVLQRSLLEKQYEISTVALERISSMKQFKTASTILFNKNAFVENSKVKFEVGDSGRFKENETDIDTYRYRQISVVRGNKKTKEYTFVDQNIKFGKTYAYVICPVEKTGFEAGPSKPVIINIETLKHPPPPDEVSIQRVGATVLIVAKSTNSLVSGFDVYKRNKTKDGPLEFVDRIEKPSRTNSISYLDLTSFPGEKYEYKIYSVDVFGVRSLDYFHKDDFVFDFLVEKKGNIPIPTVDVFTDSGKMFVKVYKEKGAIGTKIERKDLWRRETGFSLKTNQGSEWQNITLFNEEQDFVLFEDKSAKRSRAYSYRISLVQKTGLPVSYYVTPAVEVEKGLFVTNKKESKDSQRIPFEFSSFTAKIIDRKKDPQIIKANIKTKGAWDHAIISIKDKKLRVGNIHDIIYLENKDRNSLLGMKIEIFDTEGKKVGEKKATIKS